MRIRSRCSYESHDLSLSQPFSAPTQSIAPPPDHHHHHSSQIMVSRIKGLVPHAGAEYTGKKTFSADSQCSFLLQDSESKTGENVSNDQSFGNSFTEESSPTSPVSSASSASHERWCEEEKSVPLKKRRVSFERILSEKNKEVDEIEKRNKEDKTWVSNNTRNIAADGMESDEEGAKLEDKRYGRCHRTDGKGWRCSKPKLENHTVCGHHLEMRKVRHNMNVSPKVKDRKRIRMVKSRSITSLLRQTIPLLC